MVRLQRTAALAGVSAEILLKLEFFNPLSSVKDRVALAMIEDAEVRGMIKHGTVIIEPTSGNTGIGLAFVCASRGLPLILTMPESMSDERKKLLKALGARVVLTSSSLGMTGAIAKARELHSVFPDSYLPLQFDNPSNPAIHYKTTGVEIWDDTQGAVDFFISAVGTGGTITGTGRLLKERNPNVKVVAVEPAGSPVLSGGKSGPHKIQGIGAGFVPAVLDVSLLDEVIAVTDEDAAETSRGVNLNDGIPVGFSSGAAIWSALQVAKRPGNEHKRIVVIVPSCSERYLSTWLFASITAESDSSDPASLEGWIAQSLERNKKITGEK